MDAVERQIQRQPMSHPTLTRIGTSIIKCRSLGLNSSKGVLSNVKPTSKVRQVEYLLLISAFIVGVLPLIFYIN